jgi:protein TonB
MLSNQSLLHLALPTPRLPQRRYSGRRSAAFSLVFHASAAAALAMLTVASPHIATSPVTPRTTAAEQIPRLVFLQSPGPGGGGGGGGSRQSAPPSRAQGVGRERVTLPVAPGLVVADPQPADSAPTHQLVALDVVPIASGITYQMGMPGVAPSVAFSQGPGVGGGVGDGRGTGMGSGIGSGFGSGSGGGFGGGAYRVGNGVIAPTLQSQVAPVYTGEALHRKIQGTVALEAVVARDGIPSAIRVVRSLDADGLDAEAIRAVRQWRFNPGRIGETPVDVLVMIVVDLRIR